ncbi:pentapeptide repeat-containing protein [Dolichospermum sp. UHCC 0352]|nr:pentapeptide repeat-containing protein [Anabaena sp. 90]MTJ21108.1 pentapeptide repeat-containing protein [Dolichospermum sp. UHCC 0352]
MLKILLLGWKQLKSIIKNMNEYELIKSYASGNRDFNNAKLRRANLIKAKLRDANLMNANLRCANLIEADMTNTNCIFANLSFAKLNHAKLHGSVLIQSNLFSAKLNYADLSQANLVAANLDSAHLNHANLNNTNLTNAHLSGTNLISANLVAVNLTGAYLWNSNLIDANLIGANLKCANLSWANLENSNLENANLRCANLSGANLAGANLKNADLSGAILKSLCYDYDPDNIITNLTGANLTNVNLEMADLSLVNLSYSNLSDSNLTNAKLILANLSNANLSNANLEGADLKDANLIGANLQGTILINAPINNLSQLDWTIPLKFLQSDFINRLKSNELLYCPTEGRHSEITKIYGKKRDEVRDFCWKMVAKYRNEDPKLIFINTMKGKLGEEVVKSCLGDLVRSVNYNVLPGGDGKVDLITYNSNIGIQVKATHSSRIDTARWFISKDELQNNAVLACVLITEPIRDDQADFNLVFAGFLPTNMIYLENDRTSVPITELLYSGGLRTYLEIFNSI